MVHIKKSFWKKTTKIPCYLLWPSGLTLPCALSPLMSSLTRPRTHRSSFKPGSLIPFLFWPHLAPLHSWDTFTCPPEPGQSGSQGCSGSVRVAQSCLTLQPRGLQHAGPPCPSPTPGVYSDSCPLSRWWHPTLSSSVVPFSSHLQSFPESGSFQMSQLFASGDESVGVSVSTSVPPMNTQDWSPLGWTGWISLQAKGLSRAFSNTTVQKHQFFGTQLFL